MNRLNAGRSLASLRFVIPCSCRNESTRPGCQVQFFPTTSSLELIICVCFFFRQTEPKFADVVRPVLSIILTESSGFKPGKRADSFFCVPFVGVSWVSNLFLSSLFAFRISAGFASIWRQVGTSDEQLVAFEGLPRSRFEAIRQCQTRRITSSFI